VICPLNSARGKTLEGKFHRLKENISATEDDDVLSSPADVFDDNPVDLDEHYVDFEAARPFQDSPGNKRGTQGKAERLYDACQKLIPALVLPFFAHLNKSAGHPTTNTFEQNHLSCMFEHGARFKGGALTFN
jgi:hypothetical protein